MFKQLFRLDHRSFFLTLLFSFTITSVISTLILAVFLTVNYVNSMTSYIEDTNKHLLSQTNYAIDQMDKNVEHLASIFLYNNRVTAYLNAPDIENTIPVLASREVSKQCLAVPYVESIYLYNSTIDCTYSSKTGYQVSLEDFENPDAAALLSDSSFLAEHRKRPIPGCPDTDGGAKTISYYFPTNHSGDSIDALVVNIQTSALTDSISAMKRLAPDPESEFILLDENRMYLTSVLSIDHASTQDWLSAALDDIDTEIPDSSFKKIDGSYYFQICTKDNVYGWHLLNYVSVDALFHTIISSTAAGFLLFLCALAVSFLLCMHFSRKLNSPVEALVSFLHDKRTTDGHFAFTPPTEFKKIMDAVSILQNNNMRFRSMQRETKYSRTQYCLNSLISNYNPDSPSSVHQELEHLGLSYLETERLCMVVLKIDQYHRILSSKDPDDLWVLRFSAVNIIEELAAAHFTCNAFSRADDKIVLLMVIHSDQDDDSLDRYRMDLFRSIQKNMDTYLHLTVSIAYSTIFSGLHNLPAIFKNMERSLLLKIRYGHGCIIDPYQSEELEDRTLQLSSRSILQLTDHLNNGLKDEAWADYKELSEPLFGYDYSEIISACIHLIYSVYGRVAEKYPILKDSATQSMKDTLAALEYVEIADDIHELFLGFFNDICEAVLKLKADPAQQNSSVTTEKIIAIIKREYTNSALCLSSIADEVGLSPNYAGHIFKQCTGKSVSQYILEIRMDQVADYLKHTALPLNDILEKAGLEKNNYFYTRFKNYFGMSLSEYKQQIQQTLLTEAP